MFMANKTGKITGFNWLKKNIKELEITNSKFNLEIEEIRKIKPEVYNKFREWTPLKLILLNYALNVCTTIIDKTSFFKKKYYIDLFAGAGINKIKDTEDFLIGSPLIASLNHYKSYNSMIFCEKDSSFLETLKLRLKFLKKENLEIKGGYEQNLDGIIKTVEGRDTYSFFFIDPNSTEFIWKDMKKVLNVRSDIIFNFMSSQIYRAVAQFKCGIGKGEVLTNLFGDDSWKEATSAEHLVEIYKNNILKERSNAPIRIIEIRSKQFNFCYHIFFITNKTKGENKWLRAIDRLKTEIEYNSDLAVMDALNIIKKRQSELTQF